METFSALLALCVGNLICAWINGWVNNREGGDLRRHGAHYDITAMCTIGRLRLSKFTLLHQWINWPILIKVRLDLAHHTRIFMILCAWVENNWPVCQTYPIQHTARWMRQIWEHLCKMKVIKDHKEFSPWKNGPANNKENGGFRTPDRSGTSFVSWW